MVNLRSFEVPTVVKHAPGAIICLADEVKALAARRPMLVTDQGLVAAGLVDEATRSLKAGGVDYVLFDGVVPNPPIKLVDEAAEVYKAEGCDGLIGFGGGSSMDTAKAIGVVVTGGGSILDYEWADPQPIQKRIPPLVCVPTTAGTGSEVTLWRRLDTRLRVGRPAAHPEAHPAPRLRAHHRRHRQRGDAVGGDHRPQAQDQVQRRRHRAHRPPRGAH